MASIRVGWPQGRACSHGLDVHSGDVGRKEQANSRLGEREGEVVRGAGECTATD